MVRSSVHDPLHPAELCRLAGVSPGTVQALEAGGAPTLPIASAVAAVFGVSTDYLAGRGPRPAVGAIRAAVARAREARALEARGA